MSNKLGFSGSLAKRFQDNALTPLLAATALLLGLFAVAITPREEEPQIDVTLANVFVPFPGASTSEVENLVAIPMEQVLSEIEGVKHVYSVSRPGMGVLTVQFTVGEARTEALVRLYNAIYSNQDWRPQGLGILPPLVKPKGIDDVPIVTATLWTEDPERGAHDLLKIAHALEAEIKRVPGTRDVYTIGGGKNIVHVELDPQRVAGFGMTLDDLRFALSSSNVVGQAGSLLSNNVDIPVQAGTFLSSADDVASMVVGLFEGRPIYLSDIADITAGADKPEEYTWFASGPAASEIGLDQVAHAPAVTIAIAKKPGTNATRIADAVSERFAQLQQTVIPEGVNVSITRNYGKTADDKASKLIQKLAFATLSVILLAWYALGWREAIIVGTAVIITLAATLFASWAWGFTINRVSLFALIFSIGILVDDAIVVVENIQWIDSTSEEFLSYIIESLASFPVFLILTYRTGYTPPFESRSYLRQISLRRFSDQESKKVIQALIPKHRLPDDLIRLISEKAGGNPLYLEEIIKSLVERKIIQRDDMGYKLSRDLKEIEIPETIQDIVLARVDRLEENSKRTLRRVLWAQILESPKALTSRSKGAKILLLNTQSEVRNTQQHLFGCPECILIVPGCGDDRFCQAGCCLAALFYG